MLYNRFEIFNCDKIPFHPYNNLNPLFAHSLIISLIFRNFESEIKSSHESNFSFNLKI